MQTLHTVAAHRIIACNLSESLTAAPALAVVLLPVKLKKKLSCKSNE